MAFRKASSNRVLPGVYLQRPGVWRIVYFENGVRIPVDLESKEAARAAQRKLLARLAAVPPVSVAEAKERYLASLRADGQLDVSVKNVSYNLTKLFPGQGELISDLTPARCAALVAAMKKTDTKYGKPPSVASARSFVAAGVAFLSWCRAEGLSSGKNPLEGTVVKGRAGARKPQLRFGALDAWDVKAHEMAASDEDAVCALITYYLGLRASEIVTRRVGDVEKLLFRGQVLVILYVDPNPTREWKPKTPAGNRCLAVPSVLWPMLDRLAVGKGKGAGLWSVEHDRHWPRDCVHKVCDAASVPRVSAHGMRGAHATTAFDAGMSAIEVAKAMGHESPTTTIDSYALPGSAPRRR